MSSDVSYLDAAAVRNPDGGLTLFILNRHLTEAMELDLDLLGFEGAALDKHITISGPDLRAFNTPDKPDTVAPKPGKGLGLEGNQLVGSLPPLSYHVVRLKAAQAGRA